MKFLCAMFIISISLSCSESQTELKGKENELGDYNKDLNSEILEVLAKHGGLFKNEESQRLILDRLYKDNDPLVVSSWALNAFCNRNATMDWPTIQSFSMFNLSRIREEKDGIYTFGQYEEYFVSSLLQNSKIYEKNLKLVVNKYSDGGGNLDIACGSVTIHDVKFLVDIRKGLSVEDYRYYVSKGVLKALSTRGLAADKILTLEKTYNNLPRDIFLKTYSMFTPSQFNIKLEQQPKSSLVALLVFITGDVNHNEFRHTGYDLKIINAIKGQGYNYDKLVMAVRDFLVSIGEGDWQQTLYGTKNKVDVVSLVLKSIENGE